MWKREGEIRMVWVWIGLGVRAVYNAGRVGVGGRGSIGCSPSLPCGMYPPGLGGRALAGAASGGVLVEFYVEALVWTEAMER